MINSEWLDIAIGVVFVWFVFALVISALNEGMNRLFAIRSKQLWTSLGQLLDGEAKPSALLRSSVLGNIWHLFGANRPRDPNLATTPAQQLYGTEAIQSLEQRAKETMKTRISNIPTEVFAQALIELGLTGGAGDAADRIDQYIASVPNDTLKRQLEVLWAKAEGNVERFGQHVQNWFDAQMSRVSRLYKRTVRVILLPLALLVAVGGYAFGMRTDALALVSNLQRDQNLRAALVASASDAATGDLAKLGCPDPPPTPDTQAACAIKGIEKTKGIDLTLSSASPATNASWNDRLHYLVNHWRVIIGVLLTTVAISFGSSFWYDILRRLVGARSGNKTASPT